MDSQKLTELVEAAKRGDRDSLGQIVVEFTPSIRNFLRRQVPDFNNADDLTQETFIRAMCKLHQLQNPARMGSWLRTIAWRILCSAAIEKKQMKLLAGLEDLLVGSSAEPISFVLQKEREDALHSFMLDIPKEDREVLQLHYFGHVSLKKMAKKFEVPIGTIKRRLYAARQKLKKQMEALNL